jgi:hypothetical protein
MIIENFNDHLVFLILEIGYEGQEHSECQNLYFNQLNDLAKLIKPKDINHPVMTIVSELTAKKV